MALFRSALIAAASGSVGGLTFLPTPGGMALRARAIPINPNTPFQTTIRALLAFLTNYWVEDLSDQERHGWTTYARNTPRRNRLGQPRSLSGLAMWIRCQLPRLQTGMVFFPIAPSRFGVQAFTPVVPRFVDASVRQRLSFTFNDADPWCREPFTAMLVYIAKPLNPSHTAFNTSYRFAARINGHPFVPPTSPSDINLPFHYSPGQRCNFRVAVTLNDGRYSDSQYATVVA